MVRWTMYIIAEAGINHNGSLEIAKFLVDIAERAKCDAVKFQTFKKSEVPYENLTYKETLEVRDYCYKKDIEFMSTPHSMSAIEFLEPIVKKYKIASPFLLREEFLKKIAEKEKPILLSTGSLIHRSGMATYKEIAQALKWLGDSEIILMHCVSKYPCYNSHLERIHKLEEKFGLPVGLSDHTKSTYINYKVPILEKHIMRWEEESTAVDKHVSLNPIELQRMVRYARTI